MSCYIVSNDHIGYLVNLGFQLDIRGISIGDSYQSLALYDEHDRRYVTAELIAANRTSVATRYSEPVVPVTDVPEIANPKVAFKNLAQFAQALQWVRCYQYQSCDDPNWNTTFAYHYTQRLTSELISKIIECFATSWSTTDQDSPEHVNPVPPTITVGGIARAQTILTLRLAGGGGSVDIGGVVPVDIAPVVAFAMAQLGKPYLWGGAGPEAFDCSGLTMRAYQQIRINLPHKSAAQVRDGVAVDWRTWPIRAGDLIFHRGSVPVHDYGHAGNAVSATHWIVAPKSGDVVSLRPIPFQSGEASCRFDRRQRMRGSASAHLRVSKLALNRT